MKRTWIIFFAVSGLLLLGCALLVPAHFRAVDAAVIERAGQGRPGASTPTLVEEGVTFLSVEKLGPARLLLDAAQSESVARQELLAGAVADFQRLNPGLVALGGAAPMLEKELGNIPATAPVPIIDLLARRSVREKALNLLQQSRRPGVQQFLRNRELTNTVHFPAAQTSSGQALNAAILAAGLLYQGDYLTTSFRDAFEYLALQANKGGNPEQLELVYLDLLSVGRRLDWVSLTELMKRVEDIATLREIGESMRGHEEAVPHIYAAAVLAQNPRQVAKYLGRFSETGLNDLRFALRHGRGAVEMLLNEQDRIYYGGVRKKVVGYDPFGAFFYAMVPAAVATQAGALAVKYTLLLLASLFIARAIGFVTSVLNHQFGVRFAADSVTALSIAFVTAVVIEPFIGLPNQPPQEFPFKLQIPIVASAATAAHLQSITKPIMNQLTLISLVVFFVLQALIYTWCLAKLAEIRRQPIKPGMKLRLLENEDHLFDAGLYVGFAGTIISLVLIALGVVRTPSAMVAYSSTSFGVIFVSVLKIFHIRPLRRKLILESDTQA